MKILVLNAGSSSQKSCLYEFKAQELAIPSRPLWEADIDWSHRRGMAELKVTTAEGGSLEETLKPESRSAVISHMLRTLWSGPTKIISEPSAIDIGGHRVVHGGFTAGVGEHAASVRAAACEAFAFLGMKLDSEKNARSPLDSDIATADSKVRVLVIHAEEDWAIASESWKLAYAPEKAKEQQ